VNENIICFEGSVELLGASWDLESGRMVEIRLCGDAFGQVHPFKKYQQRRNGRMGTRFYAAFARETEEIVYQGQTMLAAWKDSSIAGQSVRLWLDDETTQHPFAGCQRRKNGTPGDIFALCLVELNDDETPIDQAQRESLEPRSGPAGAAPEGPEVPEGPSANSVHAGGRTPAVRTQAAAKTHSPRKLSSTAHLLVSGPLFVRYLQETKATLVKEWTSEKARTYAKGLMKVESLSDLDRDPEAVKRYRELVQRPYDRWFRQEP
jgi:hypothetical protein